MRSFGGFPHPTIPQKRWNRSLVLRYPIDGAIRRDAPLLSKGSRNTRRTFAFSSGGNEHLLGRRGQARSRASIPIAVIDVVHPRHNDRLSEPGAYDWRAVQEEPIAHEAATRVVVIDDDPVVAWHVEQILRGADCEVTVLTDPSEAAATVRTFDPDVVVTDIEMPGVTGLELMVQLREVFHDLRVVVMTAHVSVHYAVSALRGQADEFLTKPVDPGELISIVKRLADESRKARADRRGQVVLAVGPIPMTSRSGSGARSPPTAPPTTWSSS